MQPLTGDESDYDALIERIGDASIVLLGEASHGTHEFHTARCAITKRLIAEKGFATIAWEADWPDALRVNRFIHGQGEDADAEQAMRGFRRFPAWMWRNADLVALVGWLAANNARRADPRTQIGVYGLDLYSLHASMDAVVAYLETMDADAARVARERYSCFDHFQSDPQLYGVSAAHQPLSCEQAVVEQLLDLQQHAAQYLHHGDEAAADEQFHAEQNARVARNAEQYYRALYRGRASTWNLRDRHMLETFESLSAHLKHLGRPGKVIVWAHNSHLGDARATQMSSRGEINLGQLLRERYAQQVVSIGFTTYTGTVTAASDWDGPAECKRVQRAIAGSYEALFHEVGAPKFLFTVAGHRQLRAVLEPERLERAIGVIYRPQTERWSHYFYASLPRQFDAVVHLDETHAVQPLDESPAVPAPLDEVPETFPSAL